jgi:hypothetical protein
MEGEQPFRLFALPPELWIKIGKMAIEDLPTVEIWAAMIDDKLDRLCAPAVLQTCTALRNELRLEYYRTKVELHSAQFDGSFRLLRRCGRYLRGVGGHARRQIQTSVTCYSTGDYTDAELCLKTRYLERWLKMLGVNFELQVEQGEELPEWRLEFK